MLPTLAALLVERLKEGDETAFAPVVRLACDVGPASVWAWRALAMLDDTPLASGILHVLKSEDRRVILLTRNWLMNNPAVYERAVLAWQRRGLSRPFRQLLQHSDRRIAVFAAGALVAVRGEAERKRFAQMLGLPDDDARYVGAVGLLLLGEPVPLESAVEALSDTHPRVAGAAAAALGGMGAAARPALGALREMSQEADDAGLRRACRRAAAQIQAALREAPAELEASEAPAGSGLELEAGDAPDA